VKAQITERVAAVLFALALIGSAAVAANVTVSPDAGEYTGWCDTTCHGNVAPILDDRADLQIQPAPGLCMAACGTYANE
jgi:hypothetical protein